MHFENHTEDVRHWAQTLSRREFNEQLEQWYNQPQRLSPRQKRSH